MKFPQLFLTLALVSFFSGCGGGGGGSSGGGNNGGNPEVGSNDGDFSISTDQVTFTAEIGGNQPAAVQVKGTLMNAKSTVYLMVDASQAPLIQNASVSLDSDSSGTLTLIPVAPQNQRLPVSIFPGTNTNKVIVKACKDADCKKQYSGSPKTLTVNYKITSPMFELDADTVSLYMTADQNVSQVVNVNMLAERYVGFSGWSVSAAIQDWIRVEPTWNNSVWGQGTTKISVSKAMPVGTYTGQVMLMAFDWAIAKVINVKLEVSAAGTKIPESTSSLSTSDPLPTSCQGKVFIDSVCDEYPAFSAFEQNILTSEFHVYSWDSQGILISQKLVQSGDAAHGTVLDISYSENNTLNGIPRIYTPDNKPWGYDMAAYANGHLEFDIKMLSRGTASADMFLKVECGWPCESAQQVVSVPSLNTWAHIKIPVADLIASGLDIRKVSTVFEIFPTWNHQSNVHFQLDNIQWVKN